MLQTTKRLMRPAIMLSGQETADILLYITGAVHGFTASEPEKAFAVRDLFGGKNSDWDSTPLQTIFNRYSEAMPKDLSGRRNRPAHLSVYPHCFAISQARRSRKSGTPCFHSHIEYTQPQKCWR